MSHGTYFALLPALSRSATLIQEPRVESALLFHSYSNVLVLRVSLVPSL